MQHCAYTVVGVECMDGINICASDLKLKEVINMVDGRRMGAITDIEIDVDTGKLTAIVVPGNAKFLGLFGRQEDIVIPWTKISKIGFDVILVEAGSSEHSSYYDK